MNFTITAPSRLKSRLAVSVERLSRWERLWRRARRLRRLTAAAAVAAALYGLWGGPWGLWALVGVPTALLWAWGPPRTPEARYAEERRISTAGWSDLVAIDDVKTPVIRSVEDFEGLEPVDPNDGQDDGPDDFELWAAELAEPDPPAEADDGSKP